MTDETQPFKVNRQKSDDYDTGLNDKRGVYTCRCHRAMFSRQPVVVSTENHIIMELESVFLLTCLKCPAQYLVRRLKKGCVSAFPASSEAEKLIEEARKEEIDSKFKKSEMEAEAGLKS